MDGYDGYPDDPYHDPYDEPLHNAWIEGLSVRQIRTILDKFKHKFDMNKYHPLNSTVLHKTVVEIVLMSTLERHLVTYIACKPLIQIILSWVR